MTALYPHINFNGNAEEAFTFYRSVFGGDFTKVIRFKDIASAEFQVAEADAEKLMQIALPIGERSMLMGNDVPSFMGTTNERENRSKIVVDADSKEGAEKIYTALSVGAEVEVPLSESTPGSYFSMLRDKYGIEWIVQFELKA